MVNRKLTTTALDHTIQNTKYKLYAKFGVDFDKVYTNFGNYLPYIYLI